MTLELVGTVGWFLIRKSTDNIYNGCYGMVFGSKTNTLEKKIDMVIEQNKLLQQELMMIKMKDEDKEVLDDPDLEDFDIVTWKESIF